MTRRILGRSVLSLGAIGLLAAFDASGAIIDPGLYQLNNHPDGSARPPQYGMRLDELFDVTANHDIFTFNFDDPASDMKMTYDGSTIRIFGQVWGGRDIGGAYAAEATTGLYTVDFSYLIGVAAVPGDDDVWVDGPNMSNSGFIQPPVGPVVSLVDKRGNGGDFSFRLGDEDDDAGHRGHPGISGWGWLVHDFPAQMHIPDSDFLFTAELIPAPGTVGVIGAAGLLAGRRRRR